MKLAIPGSSKVFDVEIASREEGCVRVRIGDEAFSAGFSEDGKGGGTIVMDARRYRIECTRRGDSILVAVGPAAFEFKPAAGAERRRSRGLAAADITAPMPGKVLKVMVKTGDRVTAGQPLAAIEAMKMETTLYAESAATVKRVMVKPGDPVDHGAVLIELGPADAAPNPVSSIRKRPR
ncbi:MAG TPA: biotin/lipoyl-containing protein [Candidatus Binataceae bacterium]|nr:biotin/lipoyl-containing protein [Candidatus Binataceae bacterium]